jgi:hypothetical protein
MRASDKTLTSLGKILRQRDNMGYNARMKTAIIAVLALVVSLGESAVYPQSDKGAPIVLTGGTLIDLSNYGHSAHDISNAVVVLRAGKIEAVAAD